MPETAKPTIPAWVFGRQEIESVLAGAVAVEQVQGCAVNREACLDEQLPSPEKDPELAELGDDCGGARFAADGEMCSQASTSTGKTLGAGMESEPCSPMNAGGMSDTELLPLRRGRSRIEALNAKIKAFGDQRTEERSRMFNAVLRVFIRALLFGSCLAAVANLGRFFFPDSYIPAAIDVVAQAWVLSGLVIGSACPSDLLDLDEHLRKAPKLQFAVSCGTSVISLFMAANFPHLNLLQVVISVMIALGALFNMGNCHPRWYPPATTLTTCYLVVDRFSWGLVFLFHDVNLWLEMEEIAAQPIGGFDLLMAFLCLWVFVRRSGVLSCPGRTPAVGRGLALYECLYVWCMAVGCEWAARGATWMILPRSGTRDMIGASIALAHGFCVLTPAAVVVISGRERLFSYLGRTFDKDAARLRRDGAFVAELLETVPVQVGQRWWVHRDQPDERYPALDPRRNWRQGIVVELADGAEELLVQLPLEMEATGGSVSQKDTNGGASQLLSPPAVEHDCQDLEMYPTLSNDAFFERATFPGSDRGSVRLSVRGTEQVRVPTTSGSTTKEDLLLKAQASLRCVEFDKLSLELLKRQAKSSRMDSALQSQLYALSRPVREGERIDFFMSHSWHDEAEEKWEELVVVAERFRERHGRVPTFWIDIVCIDQEAITDGLKVLPVNLMACQKVLVLCGESYLYRLWCVWELFILFAFTSEATALNRLQVQFLGDYEQSLESLDTLTNFDVGSAHCYDPNEEARLQQVIEAVGTAHFNQRISNLAVAMKTRLEQREPAWRRFVSQSPSKKGSMISCTSTTPEGVVV